MAAVLLSLTRELEGVEEVMVSRIIENGGRIGMWLGGTRERSDRVVKDESRKKQGPYLGK